MSGRTFAAAVVLSFVTVLLGVTPAWASQQANETLPDGSHCDKRTWSPGANFMVNYIFDRDYNQGGHYYQVYKAISTTPNPQFLGEPNVDTWYATVRCG